MARPKEISIILKKIISEDFNSGEIEYGPDIDFKIAVQQYIQPLGGFGTLSEINLNAASFSDGNGGYYGTNLSTFGTSESRGTEWQAFDLNGNKLGFRLVKVRPDNHSFAIVNEEIGAYMVDYRGYSTAPHRVLYVPYQYVHDNTRTLEDVINNAKVFYDMKLSAYSEGFDTNKNNILGFLAHWDSWNSDQFYSTTGEGYSCMTAHTKLRYFSSWYKLITGKFYQQENLFSTELDMPLITDPEKQRFYFGKILETSDSAPIDPTRVEAMEQYTDHDNSIAARDLIYGSTLSARWLLPIYGNDEILFKNGMRANLNFKANTDKNYGFQTLTFNVNEEDETVSTYTLKQVIGSANTMGEVSYVYRTSRCAWILTGPDYEHHNDYGVIYDAGMIFIDPMYNEVPAADLSDYIRNLEDPEDPTMWGQHPLAPLRFYTTYTADTSSDTLDNVYDTSYTPLYMNFTFTGWCAPPTGDGYTNFDSIYHPSFPECGCDIDDKDIWAAIMEYEEPQPEPPNGGGSITGGGNGTFDTSGDDIETSTGTGFPFSTSLATCYLGDVVNDLSTVQDRFIDFAAWLRDYSLTAWVSPTVKVESVVSLKCMRFPENPTLWQTNDFNIKGIDDGVVCYGNVVSSQYSTYSFGTFSVTKFFDSFVDYNKTSIKLILPYTGELELDPSDVIGNTCELKCTIDWMTGNIVWAVVVDNGYVQSEMYHMVGNAAYDLCITATDYAGKTAALLAAGVIAGGFAVGAVGGLAGSMLPGIIPSASAGVSGGLNALGVAQGAKGITTMGKVAAGVGTLGAGGLRTKSTTIGSTFGVNGVLNVQFPYLQITRPKLQNPDPEIFGHMYGWKTSVAGKLKTFKGMTVVKDIHLDGFPEATSTELEMLYDILKEGVIL